MLLNAVKATNSRGSVLELPLEDPSAGFIIKGIEGLDPVKATIVSSSFANLDGEQYHSSRREARDIKLSLGLEPDYATMSVKDLRDQLYAFFLPKNEVTLTFDLFDKFTTNILKQYLDLDIVGRIESFDSPLFTKDPAVDILVRCFNPDFYDPNSVIFSGNSVADLTEEVLTYDGTVDTGVVFTFSPGLAVSDFTIYHRPPDQTLRTIDFSLALAAGDVVKISSVVGDKYVTKTHAGVESSVLYAISPQSDWLTLQPGDNSIRVYNTEGPVPFTIEYTNKYGGL